MKKQPNTPEKTILRRLKNPQKEAIKSSPLDKLPIILLTVINEFTKTYTVK